MIYFFSMALALVPGFAWLFFYLKEDPNPEPMRPLVKTFIYGASLAFLTLALQLILKNVFDRSGVAQFSFFSVYTLAFTEELFKFLAAYFATHKDPDFDEPVDAMIYMVVAAMGFATIENIGAIGGQPLGADMSLEGIFQTTTLRFAGATLLHTLSSSLIGFYWALSILRMGKKKYLAWGFVLAVTLHAFFNYLILEMGNLMYSIVFVVTAGFFILHDFELLNSEKVNV